MIQKRYTTAERIENAKAAKFFTDKLDQNPTNARYSDFKAILHDAQGEDSEAKACYLNSIALQPQNVMTRNDYALQLAKTGAYGDSVDELRKALLLRPEQPTLHKNISAVLARTGDYKIAAEHANRAVQLNPQDPMNLRNMAKLTELLGDTAGALEHNLQALQLERHSRAPQPNTAAYRAAAVQSIVRGGATSQREASALMDAARALEGRKVTLPTTQRTYEIVAQIYRRKGDQAALLAGALEAPLLGTRESVLGKELQPLHPGKYKRAV